MLNMMVVPMGDVVQKWRHRSAREPILKISRPLRKTQGYLYRASEALRPYRERSSARIKEGIRTRMANGRGAKARKHRAKKKKAKKHRRRR
jgi:hypothetical protein